MDSVERKLGQFSASNSDELDNLTELRANPHIPRTQELVDFACNYWPYLKNPTGQNIGYCVVAESSCWLETPEGFDFAKNGDLLVYVIRSRTFWVVSKLFAESLGWSIKDRPEDWEAGQRSKVREQSNGDQEALLRLSNDSEPQLFPD